MTRLWLSALVVLVVIGAAVLPRLSALPHSAEALEDTVDIDFFAPRREDWINKSDDYLRRGTQNENR